MAKKKAAEAAKPEEVAQDVAPEASIEVPQKAAPAKEEMVHVYVPVRIGINGKYYEGECTVPLNTARLLVEMANAKIEREKNVFVGNKFQVDRSLHGGARIRKTGTLGGA